MPPAGLLSPASDLKVGARLFPYQRPLQSIIMESAREANQDGCVLHKNKNLKSKKEIRTGVPVSVAGHNIVCVCETKGTPSPGAKEPLGRVTMKENHSCVPRHSQKWLA